MKTPDDPLDALLSQWQVQGEAPPSFQREVWSRIATGEAEAGLLERFFVYLLRPRGWLLASAAAVVVGGGIAWVETNPDRLNPHDAYVRSISPFASLHVASH